MVTTGRVTDSSIECYQAQLSTHKSRFQSWQFHYYYCSLLSLIQCYFPHSSSLAAQKVTLTQLQPPSHIQDAWLGTLVCFCWLVMFWYPANMNLWRGTSSVQRRGGWVFSPNFFLFFVFLFFEGATWKAFCIKVVSVPKTISWRKWVHFFSACWFMLVLP